MDKSTTITVERLRWGQTNGGIEGVTLRAEGSDFVLSVRTREGEKTLVKSKKVDGKYEVRRFPNAQEALQLLHKAGTQEVQVSLRLWRPEDKKLARARPDRSEYLKGLYALGKKPGNARTNDVDETAGMPEEPTDRPQKGRHAFERKRGIPLPSGTINPAMPDES